MSENARALIVALLCVLAVSLGAAALGGTTPQSGHGTGDVTRPSSDQPTFARGEPTSLNPPTVVLTAALLLLVAFAAAWGLYRERGVAAASVAFAGVVAVGVLCWLLFVEMAGLLEFQPPRLPGVSVPPPLEQSGSEADGGGETSDTFSSLSLLAGAAILVAVLVAARYATGGDLASEIVGDADADVSDSGQADETLAAVGEAAGEAADRLDETDADLENEVYRAWRDMTTHLDVDSPRTSTPAEFAAAATTAGMDDSHVATLTELFRDVRYGGMDATPDREERAVESLRAIESRYAR